MELKNFNEPETDVVEYIKRAIPRMNQFASLTGHPMTQEELIETACFMYANIDVIKKEMQDDNKTIQTSETTSN